MGSIISLVAVGLVTGIYSGLLGLGGGMIVIPAMHYLFGIPLRVAIGTSLAIILPTAITGTYAHFHQGNVNIRVAALIAAGAVVGSLLGARLVGFLPEIALKRITAVIFILISLKMLLDK